jgi:hypothetical protein
MFLGISYTYTVYATASEEADLEATASPPMCSAQFGIKGNSTTSAESNNGTIFVRCLMLAGPGKPSTQSIAHEKTKKRARIKEKERMGSQSTNCPYKKNTRKTILGSERHVLGYVD